MNSAHPTPPHQTLKLGNSRRLVFLSSSCFSSSCTLSFFQINHSLDLGAGMEMGDIVFQMPLVGKDVGGSVQRELQVPKAPRRRTSMNIHFHPHFPFKAPTPCPQEELGTDLCFWGSWDRSPWGHLGVISLQISGSSSHTCSPHDTP